MEQKLRMKIVYAIACVAAISLFLTFEHRKRRNRRPKKISCYLEGESKCQSSFKRVLVDNSFAPFKHLNLTDSINAKSSNSHPYEREIMILLKNPRLEYRFFYEISLTGMSELYIWVQSESQLRELVDLLSKEKVFAVDTEQHRIRSFLGFTALLQISTEKEDYLIDTIALHDVMDMLRPAFADPSILKVFHGADNDILWLQRDFHIYVVNLFDTAKACEGLSKPQKSLAYLLDTYCGVTTNKLLQVGSRYSIV